MAAVDEIAIKLGLKTGDLKAALADVGAQIKSLKQAGTDSNRGFLDSFKDFKKGFQDLKSVIAGAGIVGAILQINETAQRFAENWKGGFDEDVAATLRLKEAGQDLGSVIQNTLGRAAVTVIGTMEKLGTAVGALVYGVDAASDALNKLDAENKKAFDDAKLKKLREEEEKLAKVRRDAALAAASEGEKINLLAAEYVRLLQEQRKLQAGTVEFIRKQAEIEAAASALRKQDADVRRKEWEDRQKAADDAFEEQQRERAETEKNLEKLAELREKETDFARERLTLGQQQQEILREEASLVRELADLEEGSAEFNQKYNRLLEVRAALRKTETEAGRTNIEIAKLLLIPENQRTDLQKEQLKLLTGETTEHKQQLELANLLQRGVENLTADEKARLLVLTGQTAELKTQTAELEKQRGLKVTVTQKGDVTKVSDVQLDQVIQNLNKQIAALKASYGATLPLGYKPPELVILENALFNAKKEQDLRRDFRNQYNTFGSEFVERNYAPSDFDRLLQLINPDLAKKDSHNLAVIAEGLAKVMPKEFGSAIR